MSEKLSISIVTDIHYGKDTQNKKGSKALSLLNDFIDNMQSIKPTLVVDLGDRISDSDIKGDEFHLKAVGDCFKKLTMPHHHLIGNHDITNLTRGKNAELLDSDLNHKTIEVGGWRLIFWQPRCTNVHDLYFKEPTEADFLWLSNILSDKDAPPSILFTHLPLSGSDQTWQGNRYFENNADLATYPNHAKIRGMLEASGTIVLCIAGHVHQNSVKTIRGVHYLTLQSLSECATTFPEVSAAFGMLNLSTDVIEFAVSGLDFFECKLAVNYQCQDQFLSAFAPNKAKEWIITDDS